jgi:uncharacterized membrane protein YeaQ/YmgE (transglycosylase-associated protein family)
MKDMRVRTALSIVLVIGLSGALMFFVATFLRFLWGGNRVGPLPGDLEIAVVGATVLLAVYAWMRRSPSAALKWTRIATPAAWAVAVFVQWLAASVLDGR